ncbi:hypothetical protein Patl1_34676 [Pistacia atlantica]|uniref:Uncharacterized protein n=1 Tax=Pistacia atlantica TaxID=434234 RepID=A0ACC0ZTS1_9ROSI|nr:hypothetical protein Patl1_34676 [Pistacia atlantica]
MKLLELEENEEASACRKKLAKLLELEEDDEAATYWKKMTNDVDASLKNDDDDDSSSLKSSLDSFFSDVGASPKNNDSSSSKQSSLDSFFSDVRASLRKPSQMQQQQNATGSPFSRAAPSKSASPDEVRKNLSEFRQRSAVPPPPGPNSSYSDSQPRGKLSFEAIRESLRNMRPNGSSDSSVNRNVAVDSLSLSAFKSSLKLKPQDGSTVIGGTQELPASVFGREMREESSGDRQAMRTEFVKIYSYGELGDKLKKLRGRDGLEDFRWRS